VIQNVKNIKTFQHSLVMVKSNYIGSYKSQKQYNVDSYITSLM